MRKKQQPHNKKILLMEDEVILMRMYQEKLEQDGYRVFTAVDGELGMAIFQKEKPELVLSDIMMPGTTGLDFLAQKKELTNSELKNVPVIMLTNLDSPEFIQKTKELGAIGYIHKATTDPRDVVTALEEIMDGYEEQESREIETIPAITASAMHAA